MTGETYSLPMVALRGLTILPEEVRHFDVSRENHCWQSEEAKDKNGIRNYSSALRKIWKQRSRAQKMYIWLAVW